MSRCHVHLPVTKENGDLLLYADVTLMDANGVAVSPVAYDGPQEIAQELSWPLTFAPANLDIWIDTPGRYDIHVVGPAGYSAIIAGVDFSPAPEEQVLTPVGLTPVTNVPMIGRWLAQDGSVLRWKDPGLISAHTHDGAGANSTLLESVESSPDRTLLGKAAASTGVGGTVLGAASSGTAADGTIVGPASTAAADAVTLGDHQGLSQPASSVYLPFGVGGVLDALVDSDSVTLRSLSSEVAADSLGVTVAVPGSLPPGATRAIWLRGDTATAGLDARSDVVLGGVGSTVGFYGSDGTTQATRPVGATGVLAALLDALEAHGLIAP